MDVDNVNNKDNVQINNESGSNDILVQNTNIVNIPSEPINIIEPDSLNDNLNVASNNNVNNDITNNSNSSEIVNISSNNQTTENIVMQVPNDIHNDSNNIDSNNTNSIGTNPINNNSPVSFNQNENVNLVNNVSTDITNNIDSNQGNQNIISFNVTNSDVSDNSNNNNNNNNNVVDYNKPNTIANSISDTMESSINTNASVTNVVNGVDVNTSSINSIKENTSTNDIFKEVPNSYPTGNSSKNDANNDFIIKKDKKIWPIILIVVVLLIVGLVCGYYFLLMSPKNIVSKTIDNMYSTVEKVYKNIKETEKQTNSKMTMNGNLIITSSTANMNINTDYYIGYDFTDKDNKLSYVEVNINSNEKKVLSLSMYNEKNIMYILSNEIFDKAIGIDIDSMLPSNITNCTDSTNCIKEDADSTLSDVDVSKTIDNIKYLSDLIKNSLKENINYDKVTKTLKTDSGIYFETIYKIDADEQINLVNGIKNSLKNDSQAKNILSGMLGVTVEQVDTILTNNSNNTNTQDITELTFTLHTNAINNEFNYFELVSSEGQGLYVNKNNDETTMELKDSRDSKSSVVLFKFDNNSFSGEINIPEQKMGEISISGYKISFSLKESKKENGNELSSNVALYSTKDLNNPAFSASITSNIKYNDSLKKFDKSSSIMYDKLTENDIAKIQNNYYNLLKNIGLINPADFEESM